MSKQSFNTILLVVVSLIWSVVSPPIQARMKCWKNNDGITECGDNVPPEFAQKGHKEISNSGILREKVERAKTIEELEAKRRQAKIEEARLKEEEQKRTRDSILLNTFTSPADIERVRDDRIAALEATIKLIRARLDEIHANLDRRIAAAAADERAGETPPETLIKDIESLKRQIKENEEFIAHKKKKREEIRIFHDKKIKRFKELKGIE